MLQSSLSYFHSAQIEIRDHMLKTAILITAIVSLLTDGVLAQTPQTTAIRIHIDATDLPRKLLSSKIKIPIQQGMRDDDGKVALWYPKWVPGCHGPGGPIANIAGLKVTDQNGNRLEWERAVGEFYRINVDVPESTSALHVDMRYITNQPTTNSSGTDSFGSSDLGFVSAGTVLLYPHGMNIDQSTLQLVLELPEGWKASSALTQAANSKSTGNAVTFEAESVRAVVDSPVMCGLKRQMHDLVDQSATGKGTQIVPHTLHIFSEAESVLQPHPELMQKLRNMVTQSARLFGSHPYERFDILLATTDLLGKNGLEHSRSSFNILGQRVLQQPGKFKGWDRLLIPHEYIHAWCGKYRRPKGMVKGDFHSAKKMDLLWVYEGLTQYLGELIEARSGLMSPQEFRHRFETEIRRAVHQQGRDWRSLSDTGACSPILRAGSNNWPRLRRSQDYYMEGMLFWLEADAIIRDLSDGEKSLDDFCRHFFAYDSNSDPHPKPFDRADVITSLRTTVEFDWEGLVRRRVDGLVERFDPAVVDRLGYAIQYTNRQPKIPANTFRSTSGVDLLDSLGAVISDGGRVQDLLLDSPADLAGLGPGMEIAGVNGKKWSANRMRDAISMSATNRTVELIGSGRR